MVEPRTSAIDPEATEGIVALFEAAASGADVLGATQRLTELALVVTGSVGAAFVERRDGSGRIVAASGVFGKLRGRPVSVPELTTPWWDGGPRLREFDRVDLEPEFQRWLAANGVRRLIRAAAVVEGRHIGCFVFCYPEDASPLTEAQRAGTALVAVCVTSLYPRDRSVPEVTSGSIPSISEDDHNLFIAVTSHELRTPVTVIRGYADTLIERWDQLGERSRRSALSVIGQRAKDLGRLLDRLLSAAGDGIGPTDLAVGVPFDMVEALRFAAAELPADLRRDLRVHLPDAIPKAFGDRSAIATIVTELVTNAYKYSPDQASIELTAGSDPQAVWLRVADRGVGIRPEHVERAFERFWQSETGAQRQHGGVGLGLYLVRRVVERHKGWVSLRPRNGGGAVAEVRLPRADMIPGEARGYVDHGN